MVCSGQARKPPAQALGRKKASAVLLETSPGNSMMGDRDGQGGARREKRFGLGRSIAPKLEDAEELGPHAPSAMAGGRDIARE